MATLSLTNRKVYFLLGVIYSRFKPTERSKKIRAAFRLSELSLIKQVVRHFGGRWSRQGNWLLYELSSEKDMQRLREAVMYADIPELNAWRKFLDYFTPLPRGMKGFNRHALNRYKEERHMCRLKTDDD